MANSNDIIGANGILSCNQNFRDAYCIRKLIEVVSSLVILLLAMIILINIFRKQKVRQYFWFVLLIGIMDGFLITNIIYCFFNTSYWLYAIQTYFYNLYYLFLVGYVVKSYLLKYRQIINFKRFMLDPQNQKRRKRERYIFFVVFVSITCLYTVILIASIILQVKEEVNEELLHSCQEIWYLCFEGGCLLLSFLVLLTLYKNQIEETNKIQEYQKQFQKRQRGCILTDKLQIQKQDNQNNKTNALINNPLKSLWVWISLNVIGQLLNLAESIMYETVTPPQCLLIEDSYIGSNILQLIFVFLSSYLCFVATLFYIVKKASIWHKHITDKSFSLQCQIQMKPNIELFLPTNTLHPSVLTQ